MDAKGDSDNALLRHARGQHGLGDNVERFTLSAASCASLPMAHFFSTGSAIKVSSV